VAQFDRAIPPGGAGSITLKLKTKGYQGTVLKAARVRTNDPNNQELMLRIKGSVKVAVFVSNRYIYFFGAPDQSITRVAEVRAERKKPLELTPQEFTLEGKVTYDIKEVEKGRKYTVQFTNIPVPDQHYRGILKLKTKYPEKPEITFTIVGRFRDNMGDMGRPRNKVK
jgi:hypothetical protein